MKGGNEPLISVYLMCYNEERIIDFTVGYYKRQFPNCTITICDNMSTDKSVEIAKGLGCEIYQYDTNGTFNETKLMEIRNTIWKTAKTQWVIVCDMDEILTANQNDILREQSEGTTILTTKGYEIYGDSTKNNISNIKSSLDKITKGEYSHGYSKRICFDRTKITDINFEGGSHTADPKGEVKFSKKEYLLYHYKKLGYEYYKFTHQRSQPRSKLAESRGEYTSSHYTLNNSRLRGNINQSKKRIETIPALETFYMSKT
jgi:glycosyltransferase involved in cell wall biosynthesis